MIDNLEHMNFIEGLLVYIAIRLGDKETLMEFLRAWDKEGEKQELEDLYEAFPDAKNRKQSRHYMLDGE